jgi:hypothetical protein
LLINEDSPRQIIRTVKQDRNGKSSCHINKLGNIFIGFIEFNIIIIKGFATKMVLVFFLIKVIILLYRSDFIVIEFCSSAVQNTIEANKTPGLGLKLFAINCCDLRIHLCINEDSISILNHNS